MNGIAYECHIGPDATMYRLREALHELRKGRGTDLLGWNHIL
jgi:hypothetical protein